MKNFDKNKNKKLASHTTITKTDNMSTLYAQKITKVPVKNIDNSNNSNNRVPIKNHFPGATKEWNNSVYAYNSKRTILLSAIDKMVTKLIKNYFNANFISAKINKRTNVKNKTYISKPEIKHTNSNVIITIYKNGPKINETGLNQDIKEAMDKWQINHINEPTLTKNDEKYNKNIYYLSDFISGFYSKKVVFRIIDLVNVYLNTTILVEFLANILRNRQKVLRKYRSMLRGIKLPAYKNIIRSLNYYKPLKAFNISNISNISTASLNQNKLVNKDLFVNMSLSSLKYKAVVGARFEIRGRLTKRNTASKSMVKFGQVGTLKNIDSSLKGLPVVSLRGNHRPNLDFSSFNTKTRNGTFNVKG